MPGDIFGYITNFNFRGYSAQRDWLTTHQCLSGIRPALPVYLLQDAMSEPAPIEQHRKQRQPQRRNSAVDKRKIRLRYPRVETKKRAKPEQDQHPPGSEPLQRTRAE